MAISVVEFQACVYEIGLIFLAKNEQVQRLFLQLLKCNIMTRFEISGTFDIQQQILKSFSPKSIIERFIL